MIQFLLSGGAINYTTTPPSKSCALPVPPGDVVSDQLNSAGANYQNYLIGVQSVVIDPIDRLWILDTGRVYTPDGKTLLQSSVSQVKDRA